MRRRPEWWVWEFELSPHVLRRMEERGFTEVDLRRMLNGVRSVRPDASAGRHRAHAHYLNRAWTIVLEPDPEARVVVVITAFHVTR